MWVRLLSYRTTLAGLMVGMALCLWSCSGPNVCDCEAEAKLENPDREVMGQCEKLYAGKAYEEIEAELKKCNP